MTTGHPDTLNPGRGLLCDIVTRFGGACGRNTAVVRGEVMTEGNNGERLA